MCLINDLTDDIVKYEARKLASSNKDVTFDDLFQEGRLSILEDARSEQKKAYYKKIARGAMLEYIQIEKRRGIVVNTYGGDRKSKLFKAQQTFIKNIKHISLEDIKEGI